MVLNLGRSSRTGDYETMKKTKIDITTTIELSTEQLMEIISDKIIKKIYNGEAGYFYIKEQLDKKIKSFEFEKEMLEKVKEYILSEKELYSDLLKKIE